MENEDKIVELLSESLRNQDIQNEKLTTLAGQIGTMANQIGTMSGKIDSVVDVVKDVVHALQHQTGMIERLVQKYDKLDDLEHRIFLLEKRLEKN